MTPPRFPPCILPAPVGAWFALVLLAGPASAAEPPALEERLRRLETRVEDLSRENTALRALLGSAVPAAPLAPATATAQPASAAPALRIGGDLRLRFQGTRYPETAFPARDQLLFQLRTNFLATLGERLEGGFRLSAGDLNPNFGGTPGSTQFNFADNGSKKTAFFDQAFIRWKPAVSPDARAAITIGKVENPFYVPSRLLFDNDYSPEGMTEEYAWQATARDRFSLVAGQYVLDEITASTRDPLFLAARARWEAKWSPAWSTTLGAMASVVTHPENLTAANVANNNRGNSRTAAGVLQQGFRPLHAELALTHWLESFAGFPGRFPVSLQGEYLHNSAAPRDRHGFGAGLIAGKAGPASAWEASYRYTELGADAWYEEFLESDYGAYYASVPPGWNNDPLSTTGGHGGGTNVRNHTFRFSYSPHDCLLFSANLFFNRLLRPYPRGSKEGEATRLQIETQIKF